MKDVAKLKELETSLIAGQILYGERVMEMERSVENPCKVCCSHVEPKVIPTYFFYHKPHIAVDTTNTKRQMGFAAPLAAAPIATKK